MADIPGDIIDYNILTRLPLESLLRFKCISKHWYSRITSAAFINLHQLYGQINLMNASGYNCNSKPGHYLLCMDLDSPHIEAVTELNFGIKKKQFDDIVGCSNGLYCYIMIDRRLGLYNPLTRERLSLIDAHDIPLSSKNYNKETRYGFGYDFVGRDYKIVKISLFHSKPRVNKSDKAYFQVFSLRRKSWKNKKIAPSFVSKNKDFSVVTNNRLHWMNNFNNNRRIIITFDLHNKYFGEMSFPTTFNEASPSWIELMECSGCLYMTVNCSDDLSIWAMKEYGVEQSWTKICQMSCKVRFGGLSKVVTYRSSQDGWGEVLFLRRSTYEFVWYNLQHKTAKSS